MTELGRSLDAYRRTAESFRWEVPDPFNFGRDVVDRYAREPGRRRSSGAMPPASSASSPSPTYAPAPIAWRTWPAPSASPPATR